MTWFISIMLVVIAALLGNIAHTLDQICGHLGYDWSSGLVALDGIEERLRDLSTSLDTIGDNLKDVERDAAGPRKRRPD